MQLVDAGWWMSIRYFPTIRVAYASCVVSLCFLPATCIEYADRIRYAVVGYFPTTCIESTSTYG